MVSTRSLSRAAALGTVAALLSACTAPDNTDHEADFPAEISRIMEGDRYPHARWGLSVVDLDTQERILDLASDEFFPPGSTTKVFTAIAALDALGSDHRFTTPVYATSPALGGTITGDLILVAQADVFFGGRRASDDELSFTNFDHMEANAFPGRASLVDEDPLAGIDDLADQIVAGGVRAVAGEVLIDDRLFEGGQELSGLPLHPMYINENVLDLTLTPAGVGEPARLEWRPQVSTVAVRSEVTTAAADSAPRIAIQQQPDGSIVVSGSVPASGPPIVQVMEIEDPSSFARAALIDALVDRGVAVSADPRTGNPAHLLPASSEAGGTPLATHVSAPFSEYVKVIWKVSHNVGADNNMCLLALSNGSGDCAAGLAAVGEALQDLGVTGGYSFGDGRGGVPSDLTTPDAALELLTALSRRDDFEQLRRWLPILGVDGSIASDNTGTGATGHVFAKTGTVAGGDLTTGSLTIIAETLIGYIDSASGRRLAFALYVNNLTVPELEDLFAVFDDENEIAGLLYKLY